MMASLVVGLILLISVCVELMLRTIVALSGTQADLRVIPEMVMEGTE